MLQVRPQLFTTLEGPVLVWDQVVKKRVHVYQLVRDGINTRRVRGQGQWSTQVKSKVQAINMWALGENNSLFISIHFKYEKSWRILYFPWLMIINTLIFAASLNTKVVCVTRKLLYISTKQPYKNGKGQEFSVTGIYVAALSRWSFQFNATKFITFHLIHIFLNYYRHIINTNSSWVPN